METIAIISFLITFAGGLFGFLFVMLKEDGNKILNNSKYWVIMKISILLTLILSVISVLK